MVFLLPGFKRHNNRKDDKSLESSISIPRQFDCLFVMQNEKSESRIRHKWPLPALIGRGFSLRRLEPFGWKVLQSLHEFRLIAARRQALPPLTAQCLLVWYLSRLHNPAGLNRRTSDKSTASWQESIRQTCIGIAGKSSRTEKMCPFVWRTPEFDSGF